MNNTDFSFPRMFDETSRASKNINNFFDNIGFYNNNTYDILNDIPQGDIIKYVFMVGLIFFVISFYEIKLNHILVIILSFIIIGFLIQRDHKSFIKFTKTKKDQLNFIHKLVFDGENLMSAGPSDEMNIKPAIQKSYLYLNPVIVEFYYNIREFSQYNMSAYVNSILHVNNVIRLHNDAKIGINNPFANLDVLKDEVEKSLNALESIIYMIPSSPIAENKSAKSLDVLQSILSKYIIEMEDFCEKYNDINGLTIYSKPNDRLDSTFDVCANDTKSPGYNASYNLYVY